uniref:HMG box domain-containing protein n=1 Tax=Pseudonaja textilis TaxID=8673 RepID=A0A670YXP9_PSETE
MTDISSGIMGHGQLTTIDQSELSSQLGLSLGGSSILPPVAQSPEERLTPTPSPSNSLQEEEPEEIRRVTPTAVLDVGKKQKAPKKQKKKKDPNEPQKPVSAYALFFRDTQAAIKGQNPKATFGEVSKIVASMWDSLGEEQKQVRRKGFVVPSGYRGGTHTHSQTSAPRTAPQRVCPEPSKKCRLVVSELPVAMSPCPRCIRMGCDNPPVVNSDWDNEYCSNECVVKHCRDVFLAWLASRNSNNVVFVK